MELPTRKHVTSNARLGNESTALLFAAAYGRVTAYMGYGNTRMARSSANYARRLYAELWDVKTTEALEKTRRNA